MTVLYGLHHAADDLTLFVVAESKLAWRQEFETMFFFFAERNSGLGNLKKNFNYNDCPRYFVLNVLWY
jgi:hypothetical protein